MNGIQFEYFMCVCVNWTEYCLMYNLHNLLSIEFTCETRLEKNNSSLQGLHAGYFSLSSFFFCGLLAVDCIFFQCNSAATEVLDARTSITYIMHYWWTSKTFDSRCEQRQFSNRYRRQTTVNIWLDYRGRFNATTTKKKKQQFWWMRHFLLRSIS